MMTHIDIFFQGKLIELETHYQKMYTTSQILSRYFLKTSCILILKYCKPNQLDLYLQLYVSHIFVEAKE